MRINSFYVTLVKPVVDRLGALVLMVLLLPVTGLIALVLGLYGQPVLFVHHRPGKDGELFGMYKFTTMRGGDPGMGFAFGRLLRKTSLDELPQLWNILKGEMSFVGPRPLLKEYLDVYTNEEHRRHSVKPGITGWAQVNGRNERSLEEKLRLDLYYVSHISWGLDVLILLRSFVQVFRWSESDFHEPATASRGRRAGQSGR